MMAKTYRVTAAVRLINRVMQILLRLGFAPKGIYLLTVAGRKTGRLYSAPVALVEDDADRWLVAPYGEVNWVRNARAAGQVTLTRGQRSETVKIVELGPENSAPVLKKYIQLAAITRPYFDVHPDSPHETFIAEAPRHPVFHIEEPVGTQSLAK
jgi:deazaflavin-dependent oxidoreductase (nitroreductase family)